MAASSRARPSSSSRPPRWTLMATLSPAGARGLSVPGRRAPGVNRRLSGRAGRLAAGGAVVRAHLEPGCRVGVELLAEVHADDPKVVGGPRRHVGEDTVDELLLAER